jgi:hypothetical protein
MQLEVRQLEPRQLEEERRRKKKKKKISAHRRIFRGRG